MIHNITALALLLSALLLTACGHGDASAQGETSSVIPVVPVVKAARADLSNDITLSAEFIPYQEVDVMSKVAGYIRSIGVDIGDRVHTGELLATLEAPEMQDDLTKAASAIQVSDSEVSRARDDLQRAQSAHEMTHLSYTRIFDVSQKEKGLVPQQEVDEARSRDLQSEAQLAAAQSNLKATQQNADVSRAEQGRVKTMFQYTAITAPFDGVITKRYANVGSMIQAGTASQTQAMPVIRISQNNLLRLMLPVPESSVSAIHIGQTVDVSVPTLHRIFSGRVTRFAETLRMAHPHHGHRSRRAQSQPAVDSRHVCRSAVDRGREQSCRIRSAGRSGRFG